MDDPVGGHQRSQMLIGLATIWAVFNSSSLWFLSKSASNRVHQLKTLLMDISTCALQLFVTNLIAVYCEALWRLMLGPSFVQIMGFHHLAPMHSLTNAVLLPYRPLGRHCGETLS